VDRRSILGLGAVVAVRISIIEIIKVLVGTVMESARRKEGRYSWRKKLKWFNKVVEKKNKGVGFSCLYIQYVRPRGE
jgi:hypothetical protein